MLSSEGRGGVGGCEASIPGQHQQQVRAQGGGGRGRVGWMGE